MKTRFIIISMFAVSLSVQAATRSLESCAAIDDPVRRLACYDRLAGRLPSDAETESDTTSGAVNPEEPNPEVIVPGDPEPKKNVPAVAQTPETEALFGLSQKQRQKEEQLDELKLKWAIKQKDSYGKWIIILENGQVWHQTDSRRFRFLNSEQQVIIYRGALGSFFLREPDRKNGIRVKRVK